jgi:hypothetical protein
MGDLPRIHSFLHAYDIVVNLDQFIPHALLELFSSHSLIYNQGEGGPLSMQWSVMQFLL